MALGDKKTIKYYGLKDKIRYGRNEQKITVEQVIHLDIHFLNDRCHGPDGSTSKLHVKQEVIDYCLDHDYYLGHNMPQYMVGNNNKKYKQDTVPAK